MNERPMDDTTAAAALAVGREQAWENREVPTAHVWTPEQHRTHAAYLLGQISYSERNTVPATDLVLATAAMAHAILGGPVPAVVAEEA